MRHIQVKHQTEGVRLGSVKINSVLIKSIYYEQ